MDTLKGAINILTDKSDPANPVYKTLYPKTTASQVDSFDERVKDLVGDTITVSGEEGTRKTIIGSLQADAITTSSGDPINATVTNATNASQATSDINSRTLTSYIGAVGAVSGSSNQINVRTGAEVNAGTAGVNITIDNVEHAQKDNNNIALSSYINSISAGATANQIVIKTGANVKDDTAGTTLTINNVANATNATNASTAETASTLANSRTINGVQFNGAANVNDYAVCTTAADTAAKTASITSGTFVLATGASAKIKFNNGNTASSATLNINNTGAKALYYQGVAVDTSLITANSVILVVYNGTQYDIIGGAGSGGGGTIVYTAIDGYPEATGSLTYSGEEKTPFSTVDTAAITMAGTYKATDAGTYEALFTPKVGYYWAETGARETYTVTWSISPMTYTIPSQSGTLTYSGSAQNVTWANKVDEAMSVDGTVSGTNAASYTATFTLTDTANTQWSDSTTTIKTVTWSIIRAKISSVPAQNGTLTYSGSAQNVTWTPTINTSQITVGGTTSGTNAGAYTATFTPTANYMWSDSSTTVKTVTWSITQATGTSTLNKTTASVGPSETTTVVVTRPGNGSVTATSSNTSVITVSNPSPTNSGSVTVTLTGAATGTSTITFTVAASTNYTAVSSKTCVVTCVVPSYGIKYAVAGGHVKGTNWYNIDASGAKITMN